MFIMDRAGLKRATKAPGAKTVPGNSVPEVFDAYKMKVWNLIDYVGQFPAYGMANWSLYYDRWIHNFGYENKQTYKRGDIVMVDLEATNFRYEPSYEHSAVVLVNRYNTVMVVPCSSGRYGKNYPDIIDATAADGFSHNTGVQIEALRWVHKNRVLGKVGHTSAGLMNKIDEHQLKLIPTARKIRNLNGYLLKDVADRDSQIAKLQAELAAKELELQRANDRANGLFELIVSDPEIHNALLEAGRKRGIDLENAG
ncbi:mRNA-degrading endonuclease toxin of MazEF toxin-antitoxin module [Paenibacillus mucilaginosus]|uniref:type II toxin-antitoxin system PemK/MazF family toxin n=1 Tax=Paenibacillus mucilaginosus TaxID=61624 RepID=UPI003D20100D